ncbi:hypothetical protein CU633_21960 [Bacillus sp. V3-13]|uniref:ParB/Srx family N-terminal domain-containing protein n=1 Tax=Bacillus sp. V3-13 TaxID=2053728 RepID=UPI000C78B831|nr:ParB/Srx family N-terminal domain-containing protein [Bacillus sp. V3-13]PLR75277.1 hypothetical protein CU633_21960 [Bacillus sp. V3-13]
MSHEGLMLLGFFPHEIEAINNVKKFCGDKLWDESTIKTKWQNSRSHLSVKPTYTAGYPQVKEISIEHMDYLSTVPSHPSFQMIVKGPWAFRMVEIDPLLSLAIKVDSDYIENLYLEFKDKAFENILSLILPNKGGNLALSPSVNNFSWTTKDRGMHLQHTTSFPLVDGGIVVGFRVPIPPLPVHVKILHGKYILFDGYHRVLALRKAGHHYVPCLVSEVGSATEVQTMQEESFNLRFLLENENPPTMGHFFTDLSEKVQLLPSAKFFQIRAEDSYHILPK